MFAWSPCALPQSLKTLLVKSNIARHVSQESCKWQNLTVFQHRRKVWAPITKSLREYRLHSCLGLGTYLDHLDTSISLVFHLHFPLCWLTLQAGLLHRYLSATSAIYFCLLFHTWRKKLPILLKFQEDSKLLASAHEAGEVVFSLVSGAHEPVSEVGGRAALILHSWCWRNVVFREDGGIVTRRRWNGSWLGRQPMGTTGRVAKDGRIGLIEIYCEVRPRTWSRARAVHSFSPVPHPCLSRGHFDIFCPASSLTEWGQQTAQQAQAVSPCFSRTPKMYGSAGEGSNPRGSTWSTLRTSNLLCQEVRLLF